MILSNERLRGSFRSRPASARIDHVSASTEPNAGLAERLRALPAVDRVISELGPDIPHAVGSGAARRAVDLARESVRAGVESPSLEDIVEWARALLATRERSLLHPVINATGVLIHTNLGRVPLGLEQLRAVAEVAGAYSNLEYDVVAGRRGTRYSHTAELLSTLTGAESALVVNNNAAAVLVVLAALCAGKEVIVSRGELVEIGGEFRIPDVMAASGARLVEVGTTNRTHLEDYERAIGPDTAAILKVHPSNYRVVGFTASVEPRSLARLARGRGVAFVHDLGSGLLDAFGDAEWARPEPPVDVAVAEGADIVTFSGDKLLGGPQAGIILGRKDLIETISRHPLLRAIRVDKMTLAALQATLTAYVEGRAGNLPLWQLALARPEDLQARAEALATRINSAVDHDQVKVEAVASRAVTGGGSMPLGDMGSWAVALTPTARTTAELERALRHAPTPVIARIESNRVLLDLRAVAESEDGLLASMVLSALETDGGPK